MAALAIQTGLTVWSSVVALAKHVIAEYREQRKIRAAQKRIAEELSYVTECDLDELHISRADIPSVINGTYSR